MADDAAFATQGTFHGGVDHAFDEAQVIAIGGSSAGEVAALLHQCFFRTDQLGELLGKPRTDVDLVELHMPEGIAFNRFAARFHLGHDLFDAGAFGDEHIHAVLAIHGQFQALGLGLNVDRHFWNIDRIDVLVRTIEIEAGYKCQRVQAIAIGLGGGGRQPAAIATHDFVDDQHARIGALLIDDVLEILGAFFGGRPRTEGLLDGIHIVVDGLGQAHHRQFIVVGGEVFGEVCRRGVGVVTAHRVQDGNAVFRQLIGSDFQRILTFFHQPTLHAVGDIRQLDTTVAKWTAAVAMQQVRLIPNLLSYRNRIAKQQALIAAAIADQLDLGRDFAVTLNQATNGGRQARRQSTGSEHGDFGLRRTGHEDFLNAVRCPRLAVMRRSQP